MAAANLRLDDVTLREVVYTSAGAQTVRLRLSNAYNHESVTLGSVHVALQKTAAEIVAGTDRAATFGGRSSVTIPPDALVISDPIQLNVPALANVAVSLYVPKPVLAGGIHYSSQQTTFIGSGDQTAATAFQPSQRIASWVFVNGLEAAAAAKTAGTIVAFGDSITDGAASTVDANHRWPNFLAARLSPKRKDLGILDEGIGGNRILHDPISEVRFGVNALARFDRDVLAQPGVRYVIVLEGINDIGHPGQSAPPSEAVSAEDLIAAYKQMIDRAHDKGIKIFGCTLTPFEGTRSHGYFTPEKERTRKAVNEWIRSSHAFDGVIDFDKAVQDPAAPDRILAAYDSGDHLHPGDAGYKAMADAIDLQLFNK